MAALSPRIRTSHGQHSSILSGSLGGGRIALENLDCPPDLERKVRAHLNQRVLVQPQSLLMGYKTSLLHMSGYK